MCEARERRVALTCDDERNKERKKEKKRERKETNISSFFPPQEWALWVGVYMISFFSIFIVVTLFFLASIGDTYERVSTHIRTRPAVIRALSSEAHLSGDVGHYLNALKDMEIAFRLFAVPVTYRSIMGLLGTIILGFLFTLGSNVEV